MKSPLIALVLAAAVAVPVAPSLSVTVSVAASRLTPWTALRMDAEYACTTASVMVESRKKAKHHHTTGSFMNAKSLCVGPDAGDRCAVVVSKWALCQSRIIKTKAYTQAAARNAWRQPQRAVVNVKKIGAKAQPRLPVNPCTLNA